MDALDLATAIASLHSDAEVDLVVTVGANPAYVVRCANGSTSLVEAPDPERTVTLTVTESGAEAVRAGTANAQSLLHSGELRIGGRIDVLQAQAGSLTGLRRDDAS